MKINVPIISDIQLDALQIKYDLFKDTIRYINREYKDTEAKLCKYSQYKIKGRLKSKIVFQMYKNFNSMAVGEWKCLFSRNISGQIWNLCKLHIL